MRKSKLSLKKEFIIEDYKSMTCNKLSEKYGFNEESIRLALRRWGIKPIHKPNRNLNDDYFDIVDSHTKAYIMGFISADGSINYIKGKLSFCINSKDVKILKYINNQLESNYTIGCGNVYDNRTKKSYDRCYLQIYSKKLIQDLYKLGICEDKSSVFNMPKIEDRFFYSFLCGLIDGDGSVSKDKTSISLISTKSMLEYIKNRCKKDNISWASSIENVGGNQFKMFLNKDTLKLKDKLYENIKFSLERKKILFDGHEIFENNKISTFMERRVTLTKEGRTYDFDSIKNAAKFANCNPSVISNVISGRLKDAKGYLVKIGEKVKSERRLNKEGVQLGYDVDG